MFVRISAPGKSEPKSQHSTLNAAAACCCRWWWLLSVELTKQLSSFTVLQLPTSVLLCPGLLLSYSLTDLAALGLFIFISE